MTKEGHLAKAEQSVSGHESLVLSGVLEDTVTIAHRVPEGLFLMPQKEVVDGVGLLHWQRIGDEVALKLTQEEKPGEQGYEVNCQLKQNAEGQFTLDDVEGDMFSISKHGEGIGLYPVYMITLEHGQFVVSDYKGQWLDQSELEACGAFVQNLTKHLPQGLHPN